MRRGTALVTGASSGLGAQAAAALVAHGFRVFASMRDPSKVARVEPGGLREAILGRGFDPDDPDNLQLVALDIDDAAACRRAVDGIMRDEGHPIAHHRRALDVLVNNAGVMVEGFGEELPEDELRRVLDTNFIAHTRLTQLALPCMRERRDGRVINVSSMGGRCATPGHGAYHASKFALEGWSEALRAELVPFHVFVSLIEPGLFPTAIFGHNARRAGLGLAGRGPYAKLGRKLGEASAQAARALAGADPRQVGELVAKVAISPRPRLRYPVGADAWISRALGPALMARAWEQAMVDWARD